MGIRTLLHSLTRSQSDETPLLTKEDRVSPNKKSSTKNINNVRVNFTGRRNVFIISRKKT